ncbi:MAG: ABC transporter substrate-binding protein [Spirochaetaceae bacterium]|nr:ABC transporter substrate-binding protein [Spirochaetaceae bacterium]
MKGFDSVIRFLLAAVLLAVLVPVAVTAGGADEDTEGTTEAATATASAGRYNEVPMLEPLVASGELPPVDERVPDEPLVIEPIEMVGRYGGTLNVVANSDVIWQDVQPANFNTYMLHLLESGDIVGNFAKDYEFSDDAQTLTLYLRAGAKWSDGAPFTADDVLFMLNDMHKHDGVNTGWKVQWTNLASHADKVDDRTVRIHFPQPEPIVLVQLALWMGGEWVVYSPKHYLKNWHADYNDKAADVAKEEGFDSWGQALVFHWDPPPQNDLDKPTMNPWRPTNIATTVHTYERNPFFWQVDTGGNQLPYIDNVVATIVDPEVYQLKIIAGEADVAFFWTTFQNYALYKENEEQGNYNVHLIPGVFGNEAAFAIHQTIDDPVLRGLFRDLRFRQAMSLAIDRDEINEVVFFGQAVPRQATIPPGASYYKESWANDYAEYDPDRANALLDDMGLTARDSDGFRLGPDGETIVLLIEASIMETEMGVVELVKAYWDEVGLKTEVKPEEPTLWSQRTHAADHAIIPQRLFTSEEVQIFAGGALLGGGQLEWDTFWVQWLEANDEIERGAKTLDDFGGTLPGEEPPDEIKQHWQWRQDWTKTVFRSAEYDDLAEKIFDFYAEQLFVIGTVGLLPTPYIAKKNIGNVPTKYLPGLTDYAGDLNFFSHQLFFKN